MSHACALCVSGVLRTHSLFDAEITSFRIEYFDDDEDGCVRALRTLRALDMPSFWVHAAFTPLKHTAART